MEFFSHPSAGSIRALLKAVQLPFDDIPEQPEHFFGCGDHNDPTGVVGLEIYSADALLRSLVVSPGHRGSGLGQALVGQAEVHARESGVERIFLLTETAEKFFERLGYGRIPRSSSPDSIRASNEFANVCPESAAFMMKDLS